MNGSFSLELADRPALSSPPSGRCDVTLDLARGTLDVQSVGLWNAAITTAFLADMEDVLARFARSGVAPRSLLTTIDLRHHNIQARETIDRVQPHVHRYHELSKRTAVLLSRSALARMQAGRLLNMERHRFFTSEPAAHKWLATGLDETAAA